MFSANNTTLSVILPSYNPMEGWLKNIEENFRQIESTLQDVELIVINDGSMKNIEEDFRKHFSGRPKVKLISYPINKGKGYALRKGVEEAVGNFIIYTDIDFPYMQESFWEIYSALKQENADVVIGIRGEEYYTHLPKTRVRISKILRWLIKKFLRIPTDDTQCGLKGFNVKGKEVFLQTTIDRYLFDLEFIFIAARQKLDIQTVVVNLRPEVVLSAMNWKILSQEFGNFLKIFVRSFF